jgi:hypothetical protein
MLLLYFVKCMEACYPVDNETSSGEGMPHR